MKVYILNNQCPRVFNTETEELAFNMSDIKKVCDVNFGPARKSPLGIVWSDDSYRFEILGKEGVRLDKSLVLKETNGSGAFLYVFPPHQGQSLLDMLSAMGDTPGCWDICRTLTESIKNIYGAGYSKGSDDVKRAFVDGKLKKRKITGKDAFKVWIDN